MNDAGFRVDVFDADAVGKGPLASLADGTDDACRSSCTPRGSRRSSTAPDRDRNRFSDELDRVGELPDDLATLAREVARELDEGVALA